jgi:hypothetical protein
MTKERKVQIITIGVIVAAFGIAVGKKLEWKLPASSGSEFLAPVLSPVSPKQAEPRDVIYRMLDAARDGDVDAYLSCYSGEMARRLGQSVTEMTRAGFAGYLTKSNAEIKGIAINEPVLTSGSDAEVRVEYVYADRNEAQQMFLEKAGGDWTIRGVDAAVRVKTLVPYGTPVN